MKSTTIEADPMPCVAGLSVARCSACGSHEVTAAVAPPGERERAVYLRCRGCGQERSDLDFYEVSGPSSEFVT